MQVGCFPAAHRFQKVCKVVALARCARPRLLLAAQKALVASAVEYQVSFRAVEDVADRVRIFLAFSPDSRFMIRYPVPDLEDQHALASAFGKFEGRDHRVRRLLVVIKHIMPAHGRYTSWVFHAKSPASQIHLVDALVADVAVAVIPEPVPVVVEAIARECVFGSWAQPQLVMNARRCGLLR